MLHILKYCMYKIDEPWNIDRNILLWFKIKSHYLKVQGTADITIKSHYLKVQGTADITMKSHYLKVQGTADITIKSH